MVTHASVATPVKTGRDTRRPQVLLEKVSSGGGALAPPRINLAKSTNATSYSNQTMMHEPMSAKLNNIAR